MTASWCRREGGEKSNALMRRGRKKASKFCFVCATAFTVARITLGWCRVGLNRSGKGCSCHSGRPQLLFQSRRLPLFITALQQCTTVSMGQHQWRATAGVDCCWYLCGRYVGRERQNRRGLCCWCLCGRYVGRERQNRRGLCCWCLCGRYVGRERQNRGRLCYLHLGGRYIDRMG